VVRCRALQTTLHYVVKEDMAPLGHGDVIFYEVMYMVERVLGKVLSSYGITVDELGRIKLRYPTVGEPWLVITLDKITSSVDVEYSPRTSNDKIVSAVREVCKVLNKYCQLCSIDVVIRYNLVEEEVKGGEASEQAHSPQC